MSNVSTHVTLKNALYVPSFNQDIFSVQAASEMGGLSNTVESTPSVRFVNFVPQ